MGCKKIIFFLNYCGKVGKYMEVLRWTVLFGVFLSVKFSFCLLYEVFVDIGKMLGGLHEKNIFLI